MSQAALKSDLARLTTGTVADTPEVLAEFSTDYGGLVTKTPRAVVRPTTAEELSRIVKHCYDRDLPISARAGGFSFAGQSLNQGGIVIDMQELQRIGPINTEDGWLEAQAGARWKDIVAKCVPLGWIPPTLTTLSAAGFGMSSFRQGTQIDQCLDFEIVHHSGEILRCSEEENPELFGHALGGFGQFGVITKARQRLRRVAPTVRTYFLQFVEENRIHYLDAMVRPCYHGLRVVNGSRVPLHSHLYPMNITVETEDPNQLVDREILSDLNYSKWIYSEDLSTQDFILLGHTDQHTSPRITEIFVDVLIPWSVLEDFIRKVEAHIFPLIVNVEHTILWPMTRKTLRRPMLRTPDEPMFMGIGLYSRVPKSAAEQTLAASRAFVDLARQMGGTYYLTGSVRFDAERLADHFGDMWPSVREVKQRYDPKGLFNPGFFTLLPLQATLVGVGRGPRLKVPDWVPRAEEGRNRSPRDPP